MTWHAEDVTPAESLRLREQAKDAFLRAAAFLLDPGTEPLAGAILNAALGLHLCAKADARDRAREIAVRCLRERREQMQAATGKDVPSP